MQPSPEFQQLLLTELPRLRGYAYMITGNNASADDLVQDTAFLALRAHKQFMLGTNFRAWVYKIMRNAHTTAIRTQSRRPQTFADIDERVCLREADQENKVLSREIMNALDRLPRAQREALVLICAVGLSYDEAAVAMGCSIGTVKSRLWRARQGVQRLLLGEPLSEPADSAPQRHAPAIAMAAAD